MTRNIRSRQRWVRRSFRWQVNVYLACVAAVSFVGCMQDMDLSPKDPPPDPYATQGNNSAGIARSNGAPVGSTNASATGTSSSSSPIKADPNFALPEGELLANLARDFREKQNGHPDSIGNGKWTYFSSQGMVPWATMDDQEQFVWGQGDDRMDAYGERGSGPGRRESKPLVAARENSVVFAPALMQRFPFQQSVVIRWTSGEEGEAIIRLKLVKAPPYMGDGVTVCAHLDGMPFLAERIAPKDNSAKTIDYRCAIAKGSTLDILATFEGPSIEPQKRANDNFDDVSVQAAVVRISKKADPISPPASDLALVRQKSKTRPVQRIQDLPAKSLRTARAPEAAKWLDEQFVGPFIKANGDSSPGAKEAIASLRSFGRSQVKFSVEFPPDAFDEPATGPAPNDPLVYMAQNFPAMWDQASMNWMAFNPQTVAPYMSPEALQRIDQYPPLARAVYYNCLVKLLGTRGDITHIDYVKPLTDAAERTAVELIKACEEDSGKESISPLLREICLNLTRETRHVFVQAKFLSLLQQSTKVDPWLKEAILGHFKLVHSVTCRSRRAKGADRQLLNDYALLSRKRALTHGISAWKANPNQPETYLLLLNSLQLQSGPWPSTGRFWFDEAISRDSNNPELFSAYISLLQVSPYNDMTDAVLFGKECLETERWDSGVAEHFWTSYLGACRRGCDPLELTAKYDLVPSLEKSIAHEFDGDKGENTLVAKSLLSGNAEASREHLKSLGDNVDWLAIYRYGITPHRAMRELGAAETQSPARLGAKSRFSSQLLGFSAEGDKLFTAPQSGGMAICDVASRKAVGKLGDPTKIYVRSTSSKDNRLIAVATAQGEVEVYDAGSQERIAAKSFGQPTSALAFSPTGNALAVATHQNNSVELKLWEYRGAAEQSLPIDAISPITELAFLNDETLLTLLRRSEAGGKVSVWDLKTKTERLAFFPFSEHAETLAVAPDGSRYWVSGQDGFWVDKGPAPLSVKCLDGKTHTQIYETPLQHSRVVAILPSANGEVHFAHRGGLLETRSAEKGTLVRARQLGATLLTRIQIASTGALAAVEGDGKLWLETSPPANSLSQESLWKTRFQGPMVQVRRLPSGDIAIIDARPTVSIWDATTGYQTCKRLLPIDSERHLVAVMPDGEYALVAPRGQSGPMLINLATGNSEPLAGASSFPVSCLKVSERDSCFAVGDKAGGVTLFRYANGKADRWALLKGNDKPVLQVAFSADGKTAASLNDQFGVKLFDMPSDAAPRGDLIARRDLVGERHGNSMRTQSPMNASALDSGVMPQQLAFTPDGQWLLANESGLSYWINVQHGSMAESIYDVNAGLSSDGTMSLIMTYSSEGPKDPSAYKVLISHARSVETKTISLLGATLGRIADYHDESKILWIGDDEGFVTPYDVTAGTPLGERDFSTRFAKR